MKLMSLWTTDACCRGGHSDPAAAISKSNHPSAWAIKKPPCMAGSVVFNVSYIYKGHDIAIGGQSLQGTHRTRDILQTLQWMVHLAQRLN